MKQKQKISIIILALYNVSIMASLRNLSLVAEFGYSMILLFLLVALLFLIPSALVSAELATGWTRSGGIYIWVREAFGDRWGFLAIWLQWIHNVSWYPAILSFVAVTTAYIFNPLLATNKIFIQIVVLTIFWGMTLANYFGLKLSTLISSFGVVLGTIIPGLFIIALGISWIIGEKPIQIPFSFSAMIPDFSKIENLVFLSGLFLAFAGLEVSAGYAGEVKNPKKNYPLSIFLAAIITFFLFAFGSLSIAIVIPHAKISLVTGLMEALQAYLENYGLSFFIPLLAIMLVFGAVAEVNSWIIGPIKALHTTSIHGNLPPFFQKLNTRGIPTHLLFFQAIIVSLFSFIFLYMPSISTAYWILSILSAQIYLFMYILMFLAAIRLRYTHPHVPRLYQIPHPHKGIWLVASVGALASLSAILLGFVPPANILVGNLFLYEATLLGGLFFLISLPFFIYRLKKADWMQNIESLEIEHKDL